MSSQPDRPCIVRKGQRLEVTGDGWILPDGTTRETIDGCEIQPGASIVGLIEDAPKPRKHRQAPSVQQPEEPSAVVAEDPSPVVDDLPDPASPDELHAATVELLPDPPRAAPEKAMHPTTVVVVAVAAVGAAGWLGVKALGQLANGGQKQADQQQKQDEREQQEKCGSVSDDLVNDVRARTADLKMRRLRWTADPVELWQRCDALEARADHLGGWLRARAKTRRA